MQRLSMIMLLVLCLFTSSSCLFFDSDTNGENYQQRITDIDGITQILIPEGEFSMGVSEGVRASLEEECIEIKGEEYTQLCELYYSPEYPQHTVYVDSFWIDRTEVSNNKFVTFLNDIGWMPYPENEPYLNLSATSSHFHRISFLDNNWIVAEGYEDHPVVEVSWEGASHYCEWAGRRLPTEAEWEKSARGTDSRLYPWGEENPNCSLVNNTNNNYEICEALTVPVDNLEDGASPYGVLNMAGNASEWVSDWFDSNYYSNSPYNNPLGPNDGEMKVVRGLSMGTIPGILNISYRSGQGINDRSNTGFRCAQSLD